MYYGYDESQINLALAREQERYALIAKRGAALYAGLVENQVQLRASKMAELILHHDQPSLNIGIGFADLERLLPSTWQKMVLDICPAFFDRVKDIPNLTCYIGAAEHMPFDDASIPTITTQSTFQVLVNQDLFLAELARVLRPHGFYAITIEYHWNYPRKPQTYYAHEPDKLVAALQKLGLSVSSIQYLNHQGNWVTTLDDGFSMWILGTKLAQT